MLAATKVKISGSEKKVTRTRLRHFLQKTCNLEVSGSFKAILHRTILNDDFSRNTEMQFWSNVVTIRNNVATMLQRCAALKIVMENFHQNSPGSFLGLTTAIGLLSFNLNCFPGPSEYCATTYVPSPGTILTPQPSPVSRASTTDLK